MEKRPHFSNGRFDVYVVGKKKDKVFAVDKGRCKGCQICVTVCPYDALYMSKEKSVRGYFFPLENGKCVACRQCVYACPDFALSIHKLEEVVIPLATAEVH